MAVESVTLKTLTSMSTLGDTRSFSKEMKTRKNEVQFVGFLARFGQELDGKEQWG